MSGIVPTQDEQLALAIVELHEVLVDPLLQLGQVPLDGIPSFSCINSPLNFMSSANLLRVDSVSLRP